MLPVGHLATGILGGFPLPARRGQRLAVVAIKHEYEPFGAGETGSNRPIDESLDWFQRMTAGEFPDGARTLRARIDMTSPNRSQLSPVNLASLTDWIDFKTERTR